MLIKLLHIILFQFCFLIVYEVFLKKETFFNWNRVYLITTSILSIILPFSDFGWVFSETSAERLTLLPDIMVGVSKTLSTSVYEKDAFNFGLLLQLIWITGMVLFTLLFTYKLLAIWKCKKSNTKSTYLGYTLINLKNSENSFSFFNTIFLGEKTPNELKDTILKHEIVHVSEKHSFDLIWFELLQIIFWFNPIIYRLKKRITEVHEFIADSQASKEQQHYYKDLLAKTFGVANFSIVNQFYSSSLIKKRIIMLTTKKSTVKSKMKFLIIIPVLLGMIFYTSCVQNTNKETPLKEVAETKEAITIPFSELDNVPIFKGCENNTSNEDYLACFSEKLSNHVMTNFVTPKKDEKEEHAIGAIDDSKQHRIISVFTIAADGTIKDIKVRAKSPELVSETERVLKLITGIIPGKKDGVAVNSVYVLPLVFQN